MSSLRTRLFRAIALTVVMCVGLTVAVGLVLTRRAVDHATLRDVSHQADLIALSEDVKQTISPLTNLPALQPYFDKQHLSALQNIDALPQSAKDELAHGRSADGSVTLNGVDEYFAARVISGKPFVLLRPKSATRARWTPFVYSLLIAALAAGLLAAVAAYLLARRIARPVSRVAGAARSLARGTQPDPVPVEGATEIATLATAFNDLAEQLARAREAERNFLLSVSHELKTPLTAIRGYAEALQDGAVEPRDAAAIVAIEAARLERLVGDLLDLARMNRTDFSVHNSEIDLSEVADDAVRRYQTQADGFGVTLSAVSNGAAPAVADADRVLQVVSNLVENALRLTPAGGEVRVVTEPGVLRVEDTGPGLEDDDHPRAFERFYLHERYGRERPVGTGLGLAIVKELTQAMGGTVTVESEPGRLTTFTVRLGSPVRVVSRA
ncbi:MAG: two-component system, OmpR family, sensor kinase [Gaiellaceae bacterium]|nr:two-component system, OmpR family, sensor kinase [Gaiellaceae bacterium]